jgi:hypothetical protein
MRSAVFAGDGAPQQATPKLAVTPVEVREDEGDGRGMSHREGDLSLLGGDAQAVAIGAVGRAEVSQWPWKRS